MPAPGTALTYDLSVGIMLDIEDAISLLSPTDTPLTGGLGAEGRTILPSGSAHEVKVEWLHEELLTPRTSVGASIATAGQTTVQVAAGHRLRIATGDILLCENEYMRVVGYNAAADTVDVTRGYGGSTAAAHTVVGTLILVLGTALPEGANPENPRFVDRTNAYNLTQIFGPTAIQVSETENVVRKYGLGGQTEFQHQVSNRIKESWIAFEQALLYGVRADDPTNKWRTMGGMAFYITAANGSVIDSSTTTMAEGAFLALLQNVYDNGGNPDRAIMGSKQKRLTSAFTSAGVIQLARTDNGRGVIVTYFDSDFGRVSLILDRWCRPNDMFVFEREQAQVATLRPLIFEMLAKTGDSRRGEIVAEKTFKFRRFSHAGRFTALT